jgi:hypothetical protein
MAYIEVAVVDTSGQIKNGDVVDGNTINLTDDGFLSYNGHALITRCKCDIRCCCTCSPSGCDPKRPPCDCPKGMTFRNPTRLYTQGHTACPCGGLCCTCKRGDCAKKCSCGAPFE